MKIKCVSISLDENWKSRIPQCEKCLESHFCKENISNWFSKVLQKLLKKLAKCHALICRQEKRNIHYNILLYFLAIYFNYNSGLNWQEQHLTFLQHHSANVTIYCIVNKYQPIKEYISASKNRVIIYSFESLLSCFSCHILRKNQVESHLFSFRALVFSQWNYVSLRGKEVTSFCVFFMCLSDRSHAWDAWVCHRWKQCSHSPGSLFGRDFHKRRRKRTKWFQC